MPRRVAEERRAGILAAVAETLQEEGLPFPSYDRVADHAALSRQLVRHYFPDPEELMVTTCRSVSAAYLAGIALHMEGAAPEAGLERLIDLCLIGGGEEVPPPVALESLIALTRGSVALRGALQKEIQALEAVFAAELARSHPALAEEGRQELAHLLVSHLLGHWTMTRTLALRPAEIGAARAAMRGIVAAYVDGPRPA